MTLRKVMLGLSRIETSSLGFGCANLFGVSSSAERLHLLETAYESGIGHFDVAPMYGLGLAERELGKFLRNRRDKIIVSTKFGIEPTRLARVLGEGQAPVRRAFAAMPMLRRYARSSAAGPSSGSLGPLLYSSCGYDAAAARTSLHRSLRALSTDYIDLLLLHDPMPGNVRSDELYAYLEDARERGSIRSWGIAGEAEPSLKVAGSFGMPVPVLQVHNNIFTRTVQDDAIGNSALITFGALGSALNRVLAYIRSDDAKRQRWSSVIGSDCGESAVVASLLLRAAFYTNRSGVVLFSSTQSERIRNASNAAQLAALAQDPALGKFLELVSSELPTR